MARHAGFGVALVVLLAAGGVASARDRASPPRPDGAPARSVVEETLRAVQETPTERLATHEARIAGLGLDGLDAAVQILADGRTSAEGDLPPVRVGDRERDVLLRAIARLDRAAATERLRGAAKPSDDPRRRAAVVGALGSVGGAAAMDAMLDLVAQPGGAAGQPLARELASGFEDAFARSVAADPRAIARVTARWSSVPRQQRRAVLENAALAARPESADLLAHVLDRDPDRCVDALAQFPRVAAVAAEDARAGIARFAHEKLGDPEFGGRCEAARALGHLRDESAVGPLLGLLAGGDDAERDAAHWALRAITDLAFDPVPEAWRDWYEEETRWVRDEGPGADAGIADPDPGTATAWLRRIATLRLSREAWAVRASAALGHPSPTVRVAACDTVRSLGSRSNHDRLVHALNDEAEEVRQAALAALVALTGLDIGGDAIQWRDALAQLDGRGPKEVR